MVYWMGEAGACFPGRAVRARRYLMLDPQTRQQLQKNFPQIKPQLKQRYSGLSDQDWETAQRNPDTLIQTISQKTGQPPQRVEAEVRQVVTSTSS
jgi:hypothetical protein